MQDKEIVELYFLRDEQALNETESKYGRYLYKIAFGVLNDNSDSEESVNDTYLAAWNSIPPQRPAVLSTYLGKLTRRISIDIFRRKNSAKRKASQYALSLSELEDCVKSKENLEEKLENKDLGKAISNFLRTLSKERRTLFVGRYYFCDSLKDVARYTKMSESKVKTTLYRVRLELKDYLLKEGYDI